MKRWAYQRLAAFVAILFVFGIVIREAGHVYMAEPPFPSLLKTSFENFTAVEVASFDTSMAELMVVDLVFKDPYAKRIRINRRILNADHHGAFISEVAMLVPENITKSDYFDTSQLKVDYSKLNGVGRILVSPPFLTGSLKVNKDAMDNILMIGLGGSQMNNFIHHFFPHLNITVIELEQSMVETAKKYFGLKEDNTQHVITMDGINFLREAANRGEKFDAIYIDVCPTGFSHNVTILCPRPIFLEDDIIRLTRKCLKDSGTIVSKMLVLTGSIVEETEKIADLYRKHFANCIITPMPHKLNRVLVCSGDVIPKERFNLTFLSNAMAKFYEDIGVASLPIPTHKPTL